jgi:tellurite resistance protein
MNAQQRFRLAAAAALVDGKVAPEEKDALVRLAREIGLSLDDATRILKDVAATGKAPLHAPEDRDERAGLYRALVRICAADGRVGIRETAFLKRIGPAFGFGHDKVDEMISAALGEVS